LQKIHKNWRLCKKWRFCKNQLFVKIGVFHKKILWNWRYCKKNWQSNGSGNTCKNRIKVFCGIRFLQLGVGNFAVCRSNFFCVFQCKKRFLQKKFANIFAMSAATHPLGTGFKSCFLAKSEFCGIFQSIPQKLCFSTTPQQISIFSALLDNIFNHFK
jgi:hypothetical protein